MPTLTYIVNASRVSLHLDRICRVITAANAARVSLGHGTRAAGVHVHSVDQSYTTSDACANRLRPT